MTDYPDDEFHQVGPVRFKYSGIEESPTGDPIEKTDCWIKSEGETEFYLDYRYAKAIAKAIEPIANIFKAAENDKEDARGDLRLIASIDLPLWGKLGGGKNEYYPLARIITNAKAKEAVKQMQSDDTGKRSYHRSNLKKVGGAAKKDTRKEFIEKGIYPRLEMLQGKAAAEKHCQMVRKEFAVADGLTASEDDRSVKILDVDAPSH